MNRRALIAMSGGVDSSVAAYLMKEQGFDCIGVTMKLFQSGGDDTSCAHPCRSLDDIEDARSVASRLGIPHRVFNFADSFAETVIDRFVHAYENGITPNPCVDCNRFLKFGLLYQKAKELGCDYIATGHYARVEQDEKSGRFLLKKALDPTKDQSYVLYSLSQEELAHTMFPLGGMTKDETRRIAQQQGFINAGKHDSQDICFVPDGDYAGFIEHYTGKKYPEGNFLSKSGEVLGRHRGIVHYTIGQRRGLGLSFPEPMYVCAINPKENAVILAPERELYTREVSAEGINLIALSHIGAPLRLKAKIRYRQPAHWATVTQPEENRLLAIFDEPQRAVTRGQALVLYDGDTVAGGGTIV